MRLIPLFFLFASLPACDGGAHPKSDQDDTGGGGDDTGGDPVTDEDGDGVGADEDCDDSDAEVGAPVVSFPDLDGDGFGDAAGATAPTCEVAAGFVIDATDCDDTNAAYNPDAVEDDCEDPNDYNCDEVVAYADADLDTWAACVDCDDDNAAVNPSAVELCNDVDDDCDLTIDEDDAADATLWYIDADSDGWGWESATLPACDAPVGYVGVPGDCDDAAPLSKPDGVEVCDDANADEDCDGLSDDEDPDVGDSITCDPVLVQFDTCGATGYLGPTEEECDVSYAGTELAGSVTVTAGLQTWTVPVSGDYRIEAWGAIGSSGNPSYVGGSGAYASGVFALSEGDVLTLVVGQRGTAATFSGGGGGGTFVVDSLSPLVVAGGGGGLRALGAQDGCSGRADDYGGAGTNVSTNACAAATTAPGDGGAMSYFALGSGGGGFNASGYSDVAAGGEGGSSFLDGAEGGQGTRVGAHGGFGGGGSGEGWHGGGGGGGYTGGEGGYIAGGAGSYVSPEGTEATTTAGVNADDGAITIELI